KRPLAITVLCIVMALGTIGLLVRDLPRGDLAVGLRLFLLTSAAVTMGCAVGMWRMRRLSVYLYACWVALVTLLGIAWLGVFNSSALFVRVAVVAVSFYFICARTCSKAEPGAPPNCGPATAVGNSGTAGGRHR
ncbi:MAG: hypothetical protein NT154_30600, partial [Verrucomicrobia bacterium]|nr:hypothetical protein [Verrucomicrobiota bacterium]